MKLKTIYWVSRILGASPEVNRTFREALVGLCSMLEWHRAAVFLQNEDGTLSCTGWAGLSQDEVARLGSPVDVEIIGKTFRSGMAMVVPDTTQEPLFPGTGPASTAGAAWPEHAVGMVAPIRIDQRIWGVLAMERAIVRRSGMLDEDICFVSMVASLMGQTLLLRESVQSARTRRCTEARPLPAPRQPVYQIDSVIGLSPGMQRVFAEVHQVASMRTTVLLRGESGTGKEVIAQALHRLSPRKDAPFVRVNCAVLAETLLESELFGHEKGAFTGAHRTRKGRFELAHGGTLFLDEIGDISLSFQAKLLRVLQEREFERVGGTTPIKVDVRILLATNRPLEEMVASGSFRADLYYRINVVSIRLPPLRKRREDIPLMAEHFLNRFNRENQRTVHITPQALKILTNCYWPGNVRELENCIERAVIMAADDELTELDFPCHDNRCLTRILHRVGHETLDLKHISVPVVAAGEETRLIVEKPRPVGEYRSNPINHAPAEENMPEDQRDRLIWALEKCGGVQTRAARLLHLTPRQIWYALRKYNIKVQRF